MSDAGHRKGAGARKPARKPTGWGRGPRGAHAGAHQALGLLGASRRRERVAPSPGAPPGELAVPEHAAATRIRAIRYDRQQVREWGVASREQIAALGPEAGRVTWVDVHGFADRSALERIAETFGIHPLALADVVHVPQRPKAEEYQDHLLIVMQMARVAGAGEIEIEQMSLVLGPGWVVTFQERPGDVFDPVRTRLRSDTARIRQMGADYLAYALVDAVIDGYFPVVETVGGTLEALEEEVMAGARPRSLASIHAARHALQQLHRIQWRQRDAIGSLLRDDTSPFSDAVQVYLRDAHDHAYQTLDSIETYRDMAMSLMDVYLSMASNRLNEVMKTLTVMASIFIPLTFLAGVYGMNFDHMPELHWRWGYAAAWAAMLAIAIGLAAWFRRRGWLGRADGERG